MKSKLGIILALLCIVSFFIYDALDIKKTNKIQKETLVSGVIQDAKTNNPIAGATIAIEGTNPSSLSNANGEYAIMARGNQNLVFKHANYKSFVIEAKDAKSIKMDATNPEEAKRIQDEFEKAE